MLAFFYLQKSISRFCKALTSRPPCGGCPCCRQYGATCRMAAAPYPVNGLKVIFFGGLNSAQARASTALPCHVIKRQLRRAT
ncbi:hypothetical protein CHU32_21030 [Superficieibacter electus]|uniref:Uncharacterized protein n=1 Tax=Superficieibacter electus TaxID=2022662 RepID=A0A2P5GKD7_9ENTR|nr:hypothetical protein CHU33_17110 [Superficieibacter electus]POP44829.1 hypothetical protein CHU32_21030 [Superficieibacter electus]